MEKSKGENEETKIYKFAYNAVIANVEIVFFLLLQCKVN